MSHRVRVNKLFFLSIKFEARFRKYFNLVRAVNGHYTIKWLGRGTALTLGGTT